MDEDGESQIKTITTSSTGAVEDTVTSSGAATVTISGDAIDYATVTDIAVSKDGTEIELDGDNSFDVDENCSIVATVTGTSLVVTIVTA